MGDADRFAEFSIETLESTRARPPLVKDAAARFECRVRGKLVAGDHTIFAGKVPPSHVSEKDQDTLRPWQKTFRIIAAKGL